MSDSHHSDSLASEEASYTELDTQPCASSFFGVNFPSELFLPTENGIEVHDSVITIIRKG